MNYIQFGSLMVPSVWIAVSVSLFISALLFRVPFKVKVGDWYWNGFFVYLLTWKFSYILFNFQMFIEFPVSVVYFNGGMKGSILGLFVLSLYLLFVARKKYPSIVSESGQIYLIFLLSYGFIISLIESRGIEAVLYFIVLSGYFYILHFKRVRSSVMIQIYIVIIMLNLIITSLFESLFTLEVLNLTWIGIIVLILISKKGEKRYE